MYPWKPLPATEASKLLSSFVYNNVEWSDILQQQISTFTISGANLDSIVRAKIIQSNFEFHTPIEMAAVSQREGVYASHLVDRLESVNYFLKTTEYTMLAIIGLFVLFILVLLMGNRSRRRNEAQFTQLQVIDDWEGGGNFRRDKLLKNYEFYIYSKKFCVPIE